MTGGAAGVGAARTRCTGGFRVVVRRDGDSIRFDLIRRRKERQGKG